MSCVPRRGNTVCAKEHCRYYHDPLKFPPSKASVARNLSMSYIHDILESVADDTDVITNRLHVNHKNMVQDMIQFAGILIVKAVSLKKIISDKRKR